MEKHQSTSRRLVRVADCLYRDEKTHIYYAILKRNNRQVKRSLRTTDRNLARRRSEGLRHQVDRWTAGTDGRLLPFAEYDEAHMLIGGIAHRWFERVAAAVKPSTK